MISSAYIILTTPRTGSYLLCEELSATGVAGRPTEYLAHEWLDLARDARINVWEQPSAYLELLVRTASSGNGVFGIKMMWTHFADLSERLRAEHGAPGDVGTTLTAACGVTRIVWLRRRDTLRQAISYLRALQTREWVRYATDGPGDETVEYDYGQIKELGRMIVSDERRIQGYLRSQRYPHWEIWYEDLLRDRKATTANLLRFLGVSPTARWVYPAQRLMPQRDCITEDWYERFRCDIEKERPPASAEHTRCR